MEDPRKKEIYERQRQSVAKRIERLMANEESAEDPRKQTITEREKLVSGKRKDQKQGIDSELAAKHQIVSQEIIVDGIEKSQRFLEATKSLGVLLSRKKIGK